MTEKMHDQVQSLSARGMHTVLFYPHLKNYPLFICRVPDCGLINKLCGKLGLKCCVCIKVKTSGERPVFWSRKCFKRQQNEEIESESM